MLEIALIIIIIAIPITILGSRAEKHLEAKKYQELLAKYQSKEIVDMVLNGDLWQGMTEEMLLDSLGEPHQLDSSAHKNFFKQTYKYGPLPRKQFALRVILKDGVVTEWHHRDYKPPRFSM